VELRVSHYQFYLSPSGAPLYLHMLGAEIRTGAHFDEWEMRFTEFKQLESSDSAAFALPSTCAAVATRHEVSAGGARPMSLLFARLLPAVRRARCCVRAGYAVPWYRGAAAPCCRHAGHAAPVHPADCTLHTFVPRRQHVTTRRSPCRPPVTRPHDACRAQMGGFQSEYDAFAREHQRTHADAADAHARSLWFHRHSVAVRQHNLRSDRTFSMAVNKFADWSDEEYGALLGYKRRGRTLGAARAEQPGAARSGKRSAHVIRERTLLSQAVTGLAAIMDLRATHCDGLS
jgi:Cathepsin propeptide inhibitor domain (I29)